MREINRSGSARFWGARRQGRGAGGRGAGGRGPVDGGGAAWQWQIAMRESSQPIRLLGPGDAEGYVSHMAIHSLESGTQGDLPYGPYGRDEPQSASEARANALRRWAMPVGQPGWRRSWGLCIGGDIVGAVQLTGADLHASMHRADCGLGVQRPYRGRGWGRALMEVAIGWARALEGIDWIDLGVFEGNDVAAALYRDLGFVENGRTPDRFRVDGFILHDVHMSLWVGD